MKNNWLTLLFLMAVHFNLCAQQGNYSNYLNGLVSAYSMEDSGSLVDEKGVNNGVLGGAALVPGNTGNALRFAGSQSTMAVIPTAPSLDLNGSEITFMVDIFPTANGQSKFSVVFQKGIGSAGDNVYSIAYRNNNTIRLRNYIDGTRRDFITTNIAPVNTWSRILCVWKSGEPRVIRIGNATEIEQVSYSGLHSVVDNRDLTIGSYDLAEPAATRSFVGDIDNLMIWNRALTTEEQEVLINQNLVFNDFQDTTQPDGNDNNYTSIWSENATTASYLGSVAVGSSTVPNGYKLAVDGKLISEEVKVQLRENWPDYVFLDGYTLLPIKELEAFIQKEKHLPNIPSAEAIHKNGLELGEMNRLLLEKIEELTLHVIAQQKQIDSLRLELLELKK
ncbi:LamG domain-containing protein [Croceivirga radicis]|uniref:LamG domain-containing protein n=1 Tax=Croceivirga radicis TaxID=1929488 RepID=UPI000255B30A|nr:LamG domain-containing protein [Croceivirga radicis]